MKDAAFERKVEIPYSLEEGRTHTGLLAYISISAK
jgi:hypothetical protein